MIHSFILCLSLIVGATSAIAQAENYLEAPRVVAALEQGRAAEQGWGTRKNPRLAIALYCDAATMGSPEGYFRVGRVLATTASTRRQQQLANAYLALAIRLGNQEALKYYRSNVENAALGDQCGAEEGGFDSAAYVVAVNGAGFDLDGYLTHQPPSKQKIAAIIRQAAREYNFDARIALAIAMAESNLNATAVSPKSAQGVMQLIPATQERFGVTRPFDPEQNIRGALAYLRWLHKRFAGDWRLVVAAYNAGEGSVDRYGGVPPYAETQQYVRRVLHFAGLAPKTNI
ncbi:MAG TPA: lytic transglycosylase domain-containing protein [Accumulibacter sp.]|nr:lytic transglycosylase domain-containing protein [Accumulibacter sp.]HMW16904.1 lytic transglycosylase domain-containing protein [Accumulibacter sp.]HMY06444.1 lytic transglycosylase domain-containing protein [Accumulibacter sp.]HNC17351.1 lytic transglycosylase domain-containing protein [Accumulibacter sp.]HND79793.1 lytic transglycosylase domain-containing protein [Accumulibacter sp.]